MTPVATHDNSNVLKFNSLLILISNFVLLQFIAVQMKVG